MLIRLIVLLLCLAGFVGGCGASHDGELRWRFETKKAHQQWAVADAQRLYVCADDVYCLDIATGDLLWKFQTFGAHSSEPVLDGARLFFQCGGVYALDAETGALLWEFWTTTWATAAPAVAGERVYAESGGRLYCLDAASGKRFWSVKTGAVDIAPVVTKDRVFYSNEAIIVCLDAATGKEVWRVDTDSDRVHLAADGGVLMSVDSGGLVRLHRVETGQVQWSFVTGALLVRFCMLPSGQVILSAGVLYCLDVNSGEEVWRFSRKGVLFLDAWVLGACVIAKGHSGDFFFVRLRDGMILRRMHMPGGGKLFVDGNGAVFQGRRSRTVDCISVRVGGLL